MIEDRKLPLELSIVVTIKNDMPCLELRRTINTPELIKSVIQAAFHDRPIITQPTFRNKYSGIASLIEKGILYKEGEELFFTI